MKQDGACEKKIANAWLCFAVSNRNAAHAGSSKALEKMSDPVLLPLTAQQMEQMVSPQRRGRYSGYAAELELACARRLQNVSLQRNHAEEVQK